MNILEARNLNKTYAVENRRIAVLKDISLSIAPGEFVVITGSSGSGKTTLLTLLSGLDQPSSGHVAIQGQEITGAGGSKLAPLRNRMIGFVFQSFHLVPSMTAKENIMFPAEIMGRKSGTDRPQTAETGGTGRQGRQYAEPAFRRRKTARIVVQGHGQPAQTVVCR